MISVEICTFTAWSSGRWEKVVQMYCIVKSKKHNILCVSVRVAVWYIPPPILKDTVFLGWFHLLSDVTILCPFNLSPSHYLYLSPSLTLLQANTFSIPAITPYHRKLVIKRVQDNIKAILDHTHHSLSPLLFVLSCSHAHLSFLIFFSFLLLFTFFSSPFCLFFKSFNLMAFFVVFVAGYNALSLHFCLLAFSLTLQRLSTYFLDQHFIPLCAQLFLVRGRVGVEVRVPQRHPPGAWELETTALQESLPSSKTWVSIGSPLGRKMLMDPFHFRTLSTDEPQS